MVTMTLRSRRADPPRWPVWPFDALLWTLFLGPILSPLLRASGLPLLAESGVLARELLATYVCPTPERSLLLLGLPMAVCARCWGATIGLWAARIVVGQFTRTVEGSALGVRGAAGPLWAALWWYRGLPWAGRLAIAALPFLLWPLEIVGHDAGWWFAPLGLILLNGALAGFAAGLCFCAAWPGLWAPRHTQ